MAKKRLKGIIERTFQDAGILNAAIFCVGIEALDKAKIRFEFSYNLPYGDRASRLRQAHTPMTPLLCDQESARAQVMDDLSEMIAGNAITLCDLRNLH